MYNKGLYKPSKSTTQCFLKAQPFFLVGQFVVPTFELIVPSHFSERYEIILMKKKPLKTALSQTDKERTQKPRHFSLVDFIIWLVLASGINKRIFNVLLNVHLMCLTTLNTLNLTHSAPVT